METQKNDEKNIVLELKRQLGRMMVQVDYMYRNDREMSRLDLDVLMERTRDIYDILCDYQADKTDFDDVRPEVFEKEINEGGEMIKHDVELEIETPEDVLKEPDTNGENEGEDKSLDFDESIDNEEVESQGDPHDEALEDEDNHDDEDWEDEEDDIFRVEPAEEQNETVSEEKPAEEDNSLAARLQRTHVDDIRNALGINDKMMIINELFRGSVERYNKSVDALNDFPTLSGARVYMSELQIELQWDTESQAYKMLNDLVERRFV